ncbi:hypothetical protein PMAYCL1PPCAC_31966, partial [Pristionchus mayeri]
VVVWKEAMPMHHAGLARHASLDNYQWRDQVVVDKEIEPAKKKGLVRGLSRVFSSIGSKFSAALTSTSSLHPLKSKNSV